MPHPLLLSLLFAPAVVLAQAVEPPAPVPDEPERWTASAELNLWRPALQDDLALPGAPAVLLDDLNLDENELAPTALATFTNGDWSLRLSGFVFSTEASASPAAGLTLGSVAVAAGTNVSSEIDYASLEAILTTRLWSRDLSDDVSLRLDVGGGLRATDLSLDVSSAGSSDSGDSVWVDVVAAAAFTVELPRAFAFDVSADAGGGLDSTTWSLGARVRWQPEPYLGAQIGYRFLRTDLDDDGFLFDGALAGLYAGFTFEF